MPVYNKRGILLLPKVIVLNPKDGTNFLQLMPLGLIIIHYLFLSDCERTLAAKLFVVPEYLLLFITIDAFASIALPVIFPVFLCDNTLAANDF